MNETLYRQLVVGLLGVTAILQLAVLATLLLVLEETGENQSVYIEGTVPVTVENSPLPVTTSPY